MSNLSFILAAIVLIVYVTWFLFAGIMALWDAKREGRLNLALKVLGYPWLAVGLAFDAITNLIFSVILLHPPKEFLLTSKLQRIQREEPTGWRNNAAKWVCVNLLNPIDPTGHHC